MENNRSILLSPEMQQRLKSAYAYKEQGQFEKALRECEAVLEEYRLFPEARNLHGMLLESMGRRVAAEMAYRTAVRLDPNYVEAAQNLARVRFAPTGRRLDVRLSTFQKGLMGGLMAFHLLLGGMLVWMALDFKAGAELLVFLIFVVGLPAYLWALMLRWPRVVDEEGITRRDGRRVLWRDLTKTAPITGRYKGVRLGGTLRLYFKGDTIVDIPANGLSPSAAVVRFVAEKTGAYPG